MKEICATCKYNKRCFDGHHPELVAEIYKAAAETSPPELPVISRNAWFKDYLEWREANDKKEVLRQLQTLD